MAVLVCIDLCNNVIFTSVLVINLIPDMFDFIQFDDLLTFYRSIGGSSVACRTITIDDET